MKIYPDANFSGIISDLFDIFIVEMTSVEPVCFSG